MQYVQFTMYYMPALLKIDICVIKCSCVQPLHWIEKLYCYFSPCCLKNYLHSQNPFRILCCELLLSLSSLKTGLGLDAKRSLLAPRPSLPAHLTLRGWYMTSLNGIRNHFLNLTCIFGACWSETIKENAQGEVPQHMIDTVNSLLTDTSISRAPGASPGRFSVNLLWPNSLKNGHQTLWNGQRTLVMC